MIGDDRMTSLQIGHSQANAFSCEPNYVQNLYIKVFLCMLNVYVIFNVKIGL